MAESKHPNKQLPVPTSFQIAYAQMQGFVWEMLPFK